MSVYTKLVNNGVYVLDKPKRKRKFKRRSTGIVVHKQNGFRTKIHPTKTKIKCSSVRQICISCQINTATAEKYCFDCVAAGKK